MKAVHYKSDIDRALHASALALHRIGALDDATMREIEASYRVAPEPSAGHEAETRRKHERVTAAKPK